ncbi:MAG: DMT family transporter [Candidatus Levyibacteriota bacterium]
MKLSPTRKAILALIIANIIWGAAPPIFKWALRDIHPFTLGILRFGIASLIYLPFALPKLYVKPKDFFKLILIGFFGIFVNIAFFFLGLPYAPSINASIIGSAGPIFIILATMYIVRHKVKRKIILGAYVGLLGVLVLIFVPLIRSGIQIAAVGNAFFIISVLGTVIQTMIARRMLKKYDSMPVTFWSFFIGTLFFVPFFINEVHTYGFLPNLGYQGIIGILFGTLLSSTIAYHLYYWSLKYLHATEVSVFVYMDPVIAILLAGPLLGEHPDFTFLIGSVLVFGGIFIAEGRLHWHPLHLLHK